jgi:hypothetical protein
MFGMWVWVTGGLGLGRRPWIGGGDGRLGLVVGEMGGYDACAAGMSYAEFVYLRIGLEYEYMRMVGYLSCEFKGTFIS